LENNLPANLITENNLPEMLLSVENLPTLAALTQKQQMVMYVMLKNLMQSDDLCTDDKIAHEANVDAKTVFLARHNPQFNQIYTHLVKEITRSYTGIVINRLFNQSKTSTKAAEILLKYTDQLIDKQQRLNANINYSQTSNNHLENLVESLKHAGYTLERLLTEITDIWNSS